MIALMERLQDSFPSQSLREVFGQIVEAVTTSFEMERDFMECEAGLLLKEGELRTYAKREAEGLLSPKVLQIRKDVEEGRQKLR